MIFSNEFGFILETSLFINVVGSDQVWPTHSSLQLLRIHYNCKKFYRTLPLMMNVDLRLLDFLQMIGSKIWKPIVYLKWAQPPLGCHDTQNVSTHSNGIVYENKHINDTQHRRSLQLAWVSLCWNCIFSHVRPFYKWDVSDLDRSMHWSLWV